MRQFDDPELAELFRDDADLLDLARAAQSRDLDVPMGSNFQSYLRSRLLDEAATALHPRGLARLRHALGSRAGMAAAFAGAAGAVMIAVTVVAITQHGKDTYQQPTAASDLSGNSHVDPATDAITIAFTQPMDQASVVKALHIVPATTYSTSWSGNTLTITPTHGLSASTAYVVRIDNAVARSSSGTAPAQPIVVAFGTQPKPPASPGPQSTPVPSPPVLTPAVLAPVGPNADVVSGPGGSILVTDVAATAASSSSSVSSATSSSPSPVTSSSSSDTSSTSTPSASPSASPSTTSSVTQTGSSSSTSTTAPSGLVSFGAGQPIAVGASATAAAVAPSGRYVAALVPDSSGGARVVVENIDGTEPRQLARADAFSPIAWTSGPAVLFTSGGHLRSVDLQGVIRGAGGPNGVVVASAQRLLLAPGGRFAYLGPADATAVASGAGGSLLDLSNGTTLALPASGAIAAFAPDAAAIGWVDTSDATHVDLLPLTGHLPTSATPANVATGGGQVGALAVAPGGDRFAAAAGSEVRILDAAGHVVATDAEAATKLAFTASGTLALVAGGHASSAPLPPSASQSTPTAQPAAVPADAQSLLDRLVVAQTGEGGLSGIPVVGSLSLQSLTPRGITQGYVIAVQAVPNSTQVTASIRLVAIPGQNSADPVTSSDETVTMDRPDGRTWTIIQLTATPLSPETSGPHVVRVASSRGGAALTVSVEFDSDLDPASVAPAVTLTAPGGIPLGAQVTFDAASRTATVSVPLTGQLLGAVEPLTLTVATTLHDVDGNALSKAYTTSVTA